MNSVRPHQLASLDHVAATIALYFVIPHSRHMKATLVFSHAHLIMKAAWHIGPHVAALIRLQPLSGLHSARL